MKKSKKKVNFCTLKPCVKEPKDELELSKIKTNLNEDKSIRRWEKREKDKETQRKRDKSLVSKYPSAIVT